MTITKIKLTNFRNIESAEYALSHSTVFVGKNYTGKTNVLEAIYWLLTDKMLDGSSDAQSIKPLNDTSKKVEVEITLSNGSMIKKVYAEDWVKTRGSSEVKMAGHTTEYAIDGIKYKTIKEALVEINRLLELPNTILFNNGAVVPSKINLKQALINHRYLTEQVEEKDLRELIVGLVGDVSNEEVFKNCEISLVAKDELERYGYDSEKASKLLKEQISKTKEEIIKYEGLVDERKKVAPVDTEKYEEANRALTKLNQYIEDLKEEKPSENPTMRKLLKQIESNKSKLNELKEEELKRIELVNRNINIQTSAFSQQLKEYQNSLALRQNELREIQDKELDYKSTIAILKAHLESKKEILRSIAKEFENLQQQVFNSDAETKCPNCGYVLNAAEIDSKRNAWQEVHDKNVAQTKVKGDSLNLEIQNLKKQIQDKELELVEVEQQVNKALQAKIQVENLFNTTSQKIENIQLQKVQYKDTDEMKILIEKNDSIIEEYKKNLDQQNISSNISKHEKIAKAEQDKVPYQNIVNQFIIYEDSLKKISEYEAHLKVIGKALSDYEMKLIAVDSFMKTKLQMLDANVSKVFGNIKFQLISNKIKEGSWTPCCYPLIIGKETPYKRGSTSEKIITGIAIRECVKKALKLPDLPVIFDECASLDSNSLKAIAEMTSSQIITAQVDEHYDVPHVTNLEVIK